MEINQLPEMILRCACTVHTALGPGLLESAYEECLYYELKQSGLRVEKQKSFTDVHMAQVLTHLKLSGSKIGLLLNFNVASLKNGIKRLIN